MGVTTEHSHPHSHRRQWQVSGQWRQRAMLAMGVLAVLVGIYTFVDYYQFTRCQEAVNEQVAHVDEVRGEAFEKSIDAQIRVTETLLHPQNTSPEQTRAALEDYRAALIEQRQVREVFERPKSERCR